MNKKLKIYALASLGSVGLFSTMITDNNKHVLAEQTNEVIQEAPRNKTNSLELPPGLYIPESSEFINQEVSWEDVQRTINIEEVDKATTDSLASIAMDAKSHLGNIYGSLTQHQIQVFLDAQKQYKEKVEEVSKAATESYEVIAVTNEFNKWVDTYKTLLTEELIRSEELTRQEEERLEVKEIISLPEPEISMSEIKRVHYGLPNLGDEYLTYMPYTAITAKTTPHYRLQQLAETDEEGYRTYQGARLIALASSFGTTIGTLYDITFEDGRTMRAILGDNKSDAHTDDLKQYRDATGVYDGSSGNILEIIYAPSESQTINDVNRKINSDYPAKIKSIVSLGVVEGFGK